MRVLHLISSTDRRGAQVFASQLVGQLGGEPEHLLVAIEPGAGSHDAALAVETLGSSRSDPRGLARLVRLLRSRDVLVAHGSTALLHGAAASTLARRPFIYRNIGDPAAWGAVRGADLRIGLPLRRAAAVGALFPAAREHLISAYRLSPDRVTTIPNAVPAFEAPTSLARAAARVEFGLSELEPGGKVGGPGEFSQDENGSRDSVGERLSWVGFVGSLSEEKGVLSAIQAVGADAGLGLVVAGSGPQSAEAHALAGRVAPGRVKFLGVTDRPLDVIATSDVVVIPSRTEGIPAVAIEAGLSGVPVVATDVGGVSSAVLDGVTGVLVDPPVITGDGFMSSLGVALRSSLADRESLGSAAREHCLEHFTMDRVAQQWAALIERVAAGRRAG